MDGYGNPIPTPTNGNHPKFTTMLVLSILMTCCCNTIPGIIAIILTCVANSSYKNGMVEDADGKMRGASIALIVGLALTIVIMILYAILFAMGIVTSLPLDM